MNSNKNEILSTLGLCLRAKKLAIGDDAVTDFFKSNHARLILLTEDAGQSIIRKAAFFESNSKAAVVTVPCTKEEMGQALGKKTCSICSVSDAGFAAVISGKLAGFNEKNAVSAEKMRCKNERILQRKNKVHKKKSANQPTTYDDKKEEKYNCKLKQENSGGTC